MTLISSSRLEMFLAVVDHGTFTAAAAATFVTQPALSQAIDRLERELGTPLFARVGRRAVLTAAGRALVEPARQAVRDSKSAAAAVDEVRGLTAGRLDIVTLPTIAADPTAALVGRFRAAHAEVGVQLLEADDPDELLALVRSGTCEIGIGELTRAPAGIETVTLTREELVVITAASAKPAKSISLPALAKHPIVATPQGTSSRRLLDEALAAVGLEPTIAVETTAREAIVPLVAAGAGAALVRRTTVERAQHRGVDVLACRPPITREIVLFHRAGPLSPAARRFVALATPV